MVRTNFLVCFVVVLKIEYGIYILICCLLSTNIIILALFVCMYVYILCLGIREKMGRKGKERIIEAYYWFVCNLEC